LSGVCADSQWLLDQGVQQWAGERSLSLWVADAGCGQMTV
jgi:hypothetical protein